MWIDGEPPRPDRLRYRLDRIATSPGRWAHVGTYGSAAAAHSTASRIRTGKLGSHHHWQTQVTARHDGRADLYVRCCDEQAAA